MATTKIPRGMTEDDVSAVLQAAGQKGVDPDVALKAAAAHFDPSSVAASGEPVRKKKSSADQKVLSLFVLICIAGLAALWVFYSNGSF